MSEVNIEPKKLAKGFVAYLEYIDYFRPPVGGGLLHIGPLSRYYLERYNPKLHQRIKNDMRPVYSEYRSPKRVFGVETFLMAIATTIFVVFLIGILVFLKIRLLIGVVIVSVLLLLFIYLLSRFSAVRTRKAVGKMFDKDIAVVVQYLVAETAEFFKNENLSPKDFPIKVRHDDYSGLTYEKKGKNNFVGYVVVE
jgi:hypothetical protein